MEEKQRFHRLGHLSHRESICSLLQGKQRQIKPAVPSAGFRNAYRIYTLAKQRQICNEERIQREPPKNGESACIPTITDYVIMRLGDSCVIMARSLLQSSFHLLN